MKMIVAIGYGIGSAEELHNLIKEVCEIFPDYDNRIELMKVTAIAETHFGTYPDSTPFAAGSGVMQIDEGTFNWLQKVFCRKTKVKWKEAFKEKLGIDITTLKYEEIRENAKANVLFAVLRYFVVPKSLPKKSDRCQQWSYYKTYYNSYAGKAVASKFFEKVEYYKNLLEEKGIK